MKRKNRPYYLFLCDKNKSIADGRCNGSGCQLIHQCNHTADENYALNDIKDRVFDYDCDWDKKGNIIYECYVERERGAN